MSLSNDLVSQFVKATKDTTKKETESTVNGTTVVVNGRLFVKLDGSDLLTPVSKTTDAKPDERVTVTIKNHSATITGNISSPAARSGDVQEIGSKISEFEVIMAYKVSTEDLEATNATIQSLIAKLARIEKLEVVSADIEELSAIFANLTYVNAEEMSVIMAIIETLEAKFGKFTDISTEDLEALNAEIHTLRGHTADFTYVSADVLSAVKANINDLYATKLSADSADMKYANIDFSNIGKAAIEHFYATSGLIKDLVVGDQTISGELVGVTIKGDLIEGNTIKADKLVVKGSDGLYYKLNFEGGTFTDGEQVPTDSLHGSIITAQSITAEKISVKDLVAFDATIGGFNITEDAIYSGVKETVDNTTRGIYLDSTGQLAIGDSSSYVKYYKDAEGHYKLAIAAESIILSTTGMDIVEVTDDAKAAADTAQTSADDALRRVTETESTIALLVDSINSLVRNGETGSLIKQDASGLYYFDISGLEESISDNAADLSELEGVVLDAEGKIDVLQTTADALAARTEYVRSFTNDNDQPCLELGEGDSSFKVLITNTEIQFKDGTTVPAYISNKKLMINQAEVREELQFANDACNGKWLWRQRNNGNLGLTWKEMDD
jgi:hypothetical protein